MLKRSWLSTPELSTAYSRCARLLMLRNGWMAHQVAPMSRPLVLLVEYMFLVAATVGRCSERAREREREREFLTLDGTFTGGFQVV